MNTDEVVNAMGLPDLLALAAEISMSPDQAYGLQANDLPILLVCTDTPVRLNIPLKEVKWLDERMFCKHVHDALHNAQSTTTLLSHEVPADCVYLVENRSCNINGKSRLCACAFCDPGYDWRWVAEHSQACQHQNGEYNASQKD